MNTAPRGASHWVTFQYETGRHTPIPAVGTLPILTAHDAYRNSLSVTIPLGERKSFIERKQSMKGSVYGD